MRSKVVARAEGIKKPREKGGESERRRRSRVIDERGGTVRQRMGQVEEKEREGEKWEGSDREMKS